MAFSYVVYWLCAAISAESSSHTRRIYKSHPLLAIYRVYRVHARRTWLPRELFPCIAAWTEVDAGELKCKWIRCEWNVWTEPTWNQIACMSLIELQSVGNWSKLVRGWTRLNVSILHAIYTAEIYFDLKFHYLASVWNDKSHYNGFFHLKQMLNQIFKLWSKICSPQKHTARPHGLSSLQYACQYALFHLSPSNFWTGVCT